MGSDNVGAVSCFFVVGFPIFPMACTVVRPFFAALVLFLESLLLGLGRVTWKRRILLRGRLSNLSLMIS